MHRLEFIFQLLIFILPLVFLSNVFNPYEFPKFIFFAVTAELLALFFAIYSFSSKNKKNIFPKIDLGVILVLGIGITNLASDILGINPMISVFGNAFRRQGLITLLSGIIIFILLRSPFLFKKLLPTFRKSTAISALIISLVALWQVIQINILRDYSVATYNGRIVGTLGNPNFLGGYLAMLLPFVLWNRQKINKFLQAIIIFAIALTIFFTDSRAAYAAIFFLFLIYTTRSLLKLKFSKIVIGFFLILSFLGMLKIANSLLFGNLVFKDPPPITKERGCPESWPIKYPLKIITDIHNLVPAFKRVAPCDNRLLIWAVGLKALNKQPLLGYGQDNFQSAIPAGRMHFVDNAHNIFLETAISSGLIGLLFYLAILLYALRKSSFDIKMSLLAFIIVGQFNPLSIAQIALFWILLGFSQKENNFK